MADQIKYRYTGDGDYIPGIPARDLTAADLEALPKHLREGVDAAGIYEPVRSTCRSRTKKDGD